ncbi:MAG: molecular chaperone HtpG [Campylobacterales bacterium]
MAKHQFQTEINQLLHLMIHALYSHKEIFLRELVSNASDALDKLQYLTLTDEKYKGLAFIPRITIKADKEAKKLVISDTGIGMNDEDLVENLGTIAKSGTKSFVEKLTGDAKKDSSLIGQFGVGFYSSFMVAKKVEVHTRKAGEEKGWLWSSEGDGSYEIIEKPKESHGTEITLHLTEEGVEFANEWRVREIVRKYSNFIPFPIFYIEGDKEEQINSASALWRRNKSEITDAEYKEFYQTLSHDSEEPLLYVHTKAEGTLEYTTLFYIPAKAPFDLFRVDYQPGVRLYVKRVFINDNDKELMPVYLRFLRGIVDVEDLPLNVSREILQQNKILATIKQASTKKILSELAKLAEKDQEKYLKFWNEYGRVMKEGLYSDFANRDAILELIRFKTTVGEELTSLAAYKERMKEGQDAIWYITGQDEKLLRASPQLERFRDEGIEVLILDDEIDEIVFSSVTTYKDIPLKAVNRDQTGVEVAEDVKKSFEGLVKEFASVLGDQVKEVRLSTRLKESPACIVFDANDPGVAMQQLLKQMGGGMELPAIKPILELNPQHGIIAKLNLSTDSALRAEYAKLLLDQAMLAEGMKVDMASFLARMGKLLERAI